MSKYKVGDKVSIRTDLVAGNDYGSYLDFMDDMEQYMGKTAEIIQEYADGEYFLDIDDGEWVWSDGMLEEPVEVEMGYTVEELAKEFEVGIDQSINNGGSTSYYSLPIYAKDIQDLIEYREMNFSIGNVFKACYRLGDCEHSDRVRDLNKIIWFAQRELELERKRKFGA